MGSPGEERLPKVDAVNGYLAGGAEKADDIKAKENRMIGRTVVDHDADKGRLKGRDAPLEPREALVGLGFAVLSGLDGDGVDQDVVAMNRHGVVEGLRALGLKGAGGHTHPRLLGFGAFARSTADEDQESAKRFGAGVVDAIEETALVHAVGADSRGGRRSRKRVGELVGGLGRRGLLYGFVLGDASTEEKP